MGPLNSTLVFFLLSLALGIGIFNPLAPTKMTGVGLFKVMQMITLASLVFVLVTIGFALGNSYSLSLLTMTGVAFAATIFSLLLHKDQKSTLMWLFYFMQNLSLLYLVLIQSNLAPQAMVHLFLGGALLGIITYAMVLGHWYLVTPKLSEAPLKKCMMILWLIMGAKLVLLPTHYFGQAEYFSTGSLQAMGSMMNWVFLSMRVLWGYVTIAGLSYFAWRLIKMRSIQSATGVLYVMTFFVFAGELISAYVFFKYGLYL